VSVVRTGQVFVSHTSDLSAYPRGRSNVRGALDAVLRAGSAAVDMRYFAAREGQPAEYCRQRVRECDVYLALIGLRYGSLVPGESVSYTELEFAEATAAGRPRLVFLLEEGCDLPDDMVDFDRHGGPGVRSRLREGGLVATTFSSPDGLELAVFHALTELSAGRHAVPRQLPAAVRHFAGRSSWRRSAPWSDSDLRGSKPGARW
jgi:Domain of unknown function (DUF4062)